MKRVLLLILVAAVVVAAAGFRVPSNAATVDGVTISQSALNADLVAIGDSPAIQCYLATEFQAGGQSSVGILPVHGAHTGITSVGSVENASFVRFWLRDMMQSALISQLAVRDHVTVTAGAQAVGHDEFTADVEQASATSGQTRPAACSSPATVTGKPVTPLSSIPKSFSNEQAQNLAARLALALPRGANLSSSYLHAYYGSHQATFEDRCLGVVVFSTASAATTAHHQALTTGKPFASLGTTESLGCGPQAAIAAQFGAAISQLGQGQVSTVLSTSQSGKYGLVSVTSLKPAPYKTVTVAETLAQAGTTRESKAIERVVAAAHVSVDPRYGVVGPRTLVVEPPAVPPPVTLVNPLADTPASVATPDAAASLPGIVPSGSSTP